MDFVFRKGTLLVTFGDEEQAHSQESKTLGYKPGGGIVSLSVNTDKAGNLISIIIDDIE